MYLVAEIGAVAGAVSSDAFCILKRNKKNQQTAVAS